MRIQHNIMAMNAYRNYDNNTSALSKNLEKLSSGYQINRAGDDAAGLAISEKMRAQITGQNTAQKNAKDGISLVQTAEGALAEVHDMLNRMIELADQSANGTYEATDRAQLQKEVIQLQKEINRIADSANFNGSKLLDGSLSYSHVSGQGLTLTDLPPVAGMEETIIIQGAGSDDPGYANGVTQMNTGDKICFTVAWQDGRGKGYSTTAELTYDKEKGLLVAGDGTTYAAKEANSTDPRWIEADCVSAAFLGEFNKDPEFAKMFDVELASDKAKLYFTNKVPGTKGGKLTLADYYFVDTSGDRTTLYNTSLLVSGKSVSPADTVQKLDLSGMKVLSGDGTDTKEDLQNALFEIGGKQFVFAASDAQVQNLKDLGPDVTIISLAGDNYDAEDDAENVAAALQRATGMEFSVNRSDEIIYTGEYRLSTTEEGMTLQIGDTGDDFNQMGVFVKDMHTAAMGVDLVDISTQNGARIAVDLLKDAVEYVSGVRGTLGATQNRLDHTMNNLSVMEENIQDAESTIRDADVADEMMAYTKNNILIQSAQAMLAQSNQVPQGVLQLLQ